MATNQTATPDPKAPIQYTKLLIHGEWVDAVDGKEFDVYNPSTGDVICKVAEAGPEDVDRAVRSAREAFNGPWSQMSPLERSKRLWKLAELIEENAAEIARIETLDQGKPYGISLHSDVPSAANMFYYMSGWATKIEGETIPVSAGPGFHVYTRREAIGVVGCVVPWNFPLVIASWKLAPALAAGNTVVLKPAESTPLSALMLGKLALDAGIPPGVLNVVPGFGSRTGQALTEHVGVDKVSFTGSTATGRRILEASQGNMKRVTLELGGKSANIIFADADIKKAIKGSSDGIFFNAGQACAAGSRLYIHEDVYDEVVAGLTEMAKNIKVGDGFDPTSEIGPLVSQQHFDRVSGYLRDGVNEGGLAVTGGGRVGEKGYFIAPTIFTGVSAEDTVVREEIFGPVVVAIKFRDEDEVIAAANNSPYGLAAGIWSQDAARVHRVAAAMQSGTVWVNCYGVFDPSMPFGGYKQSGWGREMGHEVLHAYTELKTVCVNIGK